jgi:hypothetical protein
MDTHASPTTSAHCVAQTPSPARVGTRWITRERPKVDRIACPWLIRRFIDADATFYFVPAQRVLCEAKALDATPFDVEGVELSHDWEKCSFDALLAKYSLTDPALHELAVIVRGADTSRPGIAPEAAGLLGISIGFSMVYADDHAQLEAAMPLYDALYAWCKSGRSESHGWRSHSMPTAPLS